MQLKSIQKINTLEFDLNVQPKKKLKKPKGKNKGKTTKISIVNPLKKAVSLDKRVKTLELPSLKLFPKKAQFNIKDKNKNKVRSNSEKISTLVLKKNFNIIEQVDNLVQMTSNPKQYTVFSKVLHF